MNYSKDFLKLYPNYTNRPTQQPPLPSNTPIPSNVQGTPINYKIVNTNYGQLYSIPLNRDPIHTEELITGYGNLDSRLGTNLGTTK